MSTLPCVLTIAGSDSSAGAGIGLDLKVFQALETYGLTALTAVTAQNSTGIRSIHSVPSDTLRDQLEAIFSDFSVAAIKTGMLGSRDIIETIVDVLRKQRHLPPLIVDPVWISESGTTLLEEDAWSVLMERLLPLAELVTPNRLEAARLLGKEALEPQDLELAGRKILELGVEYVLIKGGHFEGAMAEDVVFSRGESHTLQSPRLNVGRVHGTGCALSAAIAAERAKGQSMQRAIQRARNHLHAWIGSATQLGHGARYLMPGATGPCAMGSNATESNATGSEIE